MVESMGEDGNLEWGNTRLGGGKPPKKWGGMIYCKKIASWRENYAFFPSKLAFSPFQSGISPPPFDSNLTLSLNKLLSPFSDEQPLDSI